MYESQWARDSGLLATVCFSSCFLDSPCVSVRESAAYVEVGAFKTRRREAEFSEGSSRRGGSCDRKCVSVCEVGASPVPAAPKCVCTVETLPDNRGISYNIRSLSGLETHTRTHTHTHTHTRRGRWSLLCACPRQKHAHVPCCPSYRLIFLSDTKPLGMA